MFKYIKRLDETCEKTDTEKMGPILDKYGISSLVGMIMCFEKNQED